MEYLVGLGASIQLYLFLVCRYSECKRLIQLGYTGQKFFVNARPALFDLNFASDFFLFWKKLFGLTLLKIILTVNKDEP